MVPQKLSSIMHEYNETAKKLTIHVTSEMSIGNNWWGGFSKRNIVEAISEFPDTETIELVVNNYGGDLAEALTIRSYLAEQATKGKKVKATFVGFSASAATVMVMHPSVERVMDEHAYMLIHNARSAVWDGEAKDFRSIADDLDMFSDTIADIYTEVSNKNKKKIKEIMENSNWLSAKVVLDLGLVTSVEKGNKETQSISENNYKFINSKFPKMEKTPKPGGIAIALNALLGAIGLQPSEILNNAVEPPTIDSVGMGDDEGMAEAPPIVTNQTPPPPAPTPTIVYPIANAQVSGRQGRYFNFQTAKKPINKTKVNTVVVQPKNNHKLNVVEAFFIQNIQHQPLPQNCGCGTVPAALDHLDWTAISAELGDQVVEVATNIVIDRFKATFGAYIPTGWGYIRDRIYTQLTASFSDFLQPWGCGFNPKGLATFDLQNNIPRAVKGDLTICDGLLAQSYFNYLLNNSYAPFEHPLAMWLAEQLVEQAMVDVVKAFWFGTYNPAAIDTPAASPLDCFDGIHTIADNAITAGTVLPIATGAYNALTNNATAILAAFRAGFDPAWMGQNVIIYCSPEFAERYAVENELNCTSCTPENENYSWTELMPLRVRHTNHFLVPTLPFGSGDRLIATIPGNIMFMGGNPSEWQTIRTERNGRQVCMYFDAVGAAAVQSLRPRFFAINDQPAVAITW